MFFENLLYSPISIYFQKQLSNILVVDDEEEIQNLVRIMLEAEDHKVSIASNGEEALALISCNHFDLIILDVVMQHMDGLEVCRKIRKTESMKNTPIIMFSALGRGVDTMLDENDKADDYLEKPFERKTLLEKVNNLLKKENDSQLF